MGRPAQTRTLTALEARHAGQTGAAAGMTRDSARRLAAKLGVPEPAWCTKRAHYRPPPKAKTSSFEPDPSWDRALQALGLETTATGIDTQIPEALRAWRAGNGCRVVQISLRGVTLHELGERRRDFPNVAAAVSAVTVAA